MIVITFGALHHTRTPLLRPNACDRASAAALAKQGFPAIGTTSLGVAAAAACPTARRRPKRKPARRPDGSAPPDRTCSRERPRPGSATTPSRSRLASELVAAGAVGVDLEGAGAGRGDRRGGSVRGVTRDGASRRDRLRRDDQSTGTGSSGTVIKHQVVQLTVGAPAGHGDTTDVCVARSRRAIPPTPLARPPTYCRRHRAAVTTLDERGTSRRRSRLILSFLDLS